MPRGMPGRDGAKSCALCMLHAPCAHSNALDVPKNATPDDADGGKQSKKKKNEQTKFANADDAWKQTRREGTKNARREGTRFCRSNGAAGTSAIKDACRIACLSKERETRSYGTLYTEPAAMSTEKAKQGWNERKPSAIANI